MYYVYLIRSLKDPSKTYIGYTIDLERRLNQHNTGASVYTSDHKPWMIIMHLCFANESKALDFEKYLKSGSGNSFAKKRLW